ncbi:RecQ family ATP-dependent DNA helicase [Sutcliffiella deserti]|uniref:RecQ family ATP-dependent DNA helicase n=1 Tax=Sutcliffiella deserti TaxID=2875501 RepID=UPI001CC0932C|nr:ATP-dependent DNA helicase RecQ [Sutcliffiella deserti]
MNLEQVLKSKFGFRSFKAGQKEIIHDVALGNDVLALLPTGGGKSLCYQLSGYLLQGTVLIVSPLLSLMEDQVQQMKSNGEKRVVAINSFLNYQEKEKLLSSDLNIYKFIFISPEMLQVKRWIIKLQKLSVGLFVVDEAHCVSQWGHDFRTDYLKLGKVKKVLGSPPCLALTATATKTVIEDIKNYLLLTSPNEHINSIDRPNIALKVEKLKNNQEKRMRLLELLSQFPSPGMVYFSSRVKAEEIALFLEEQGLEGVAFYHAGLTADQRILIQQQFLLGQLNVICCTSAFGMGINKANVRFVIHYHQPTQLEAYVQEIGRAGRDGEKSIAVLLKSDEDSMLPHLLIEGELPESVWVTAVMNEMVEKWGTISTLTEEIWNDLALRFPNNEVQWRYLSYQITYYIEHNGPISKINLKSGVSFVINQIEKRTAAKMTKLQSFEEWTQSKACRRKAILGYFGESKVSLVENCCDNCGISLEEYVLSPSNGSRKDDKANSLSWERLLEKILVQDIHDEK